MLTYEHPIFLGTVFNALPPNLKSVQSELAYEIPFPANDHVFLNEHWIMVQVQSTWFPVIDRNPQRFVPNIFNAKDSDFQKAPSTNLSLRFTSVAFLAAGHELSSAVTAAASLHSMKSAWVSSRSTRPVET